MNRLATIIIAIFFLNQCSFNENSRIWKDKEKEIDIKEDDFVIFDIADTHYTTKNLSNQSKIVFSVNMKEKI